MTTNNDESATLIFYSITRSNKKCSHDPNINKKRKNNLKLYI
jgi:hypothetical protein